MPLSHFAPGFVSAGQLNALVDQLNALSADTGWQTITNVNSGYTVGLAQYRIEDNELRVQLSLTRNTGTVAINDVVAGLPAGKFPTRTTTYRIPFQNGASGSGHLAIDPSAGGLTVVSLTGTANSGLVTIPLPIPMD